MTDWDLVITCGQSQMVGHAYPPNPFFGYIGPPGTSLDRCTEWIDDTAEGYPPGFYEVKDPAFPNQPQYSGRNGSCLPAFANMFWRGTGKKLLIVRSAVDGTALLNDNSGANGNWSTFGTLFADSVALVEDAVANLPGGVTIDECFIICSLGGKDAQGGLGITGPSGTGADSAMAAAWGSLLSRYQAALSIDPTRLYLEGMYHVPGMNEQDCLHVRESQEAAVAASGGAIKIAFDLGGTFSIANKTLINDGIHYGQPGLNIMGEEFARFALDDLGYAPPPPEEIGHVSVQALRLRNLPRVPPLPKTFDGPQTIDWTCPTGVTQIGYDLRGSGGGGKGGGSLSSGGGGGGQGERRVGSLSVTPGHVYRFTLTDGGVGINYATAGNGATGADSTIEGVTVPGNLVTAKGGQGGGVTLARNGGVGGTGGNGGTGTNGAAGGTAVNSSGTDGGDGGGADTTTTTSLGRGGITGSVSGKLGNPPGGGGGGGKGNSPGGHGVKGAAARLTITDTTP